MAKGMSVSITSGVFYSENLEELKKQFDEAPRKAIVFYHMHKTGGRSLATALQESVGGKKVHRVSSADECDSFEKKVANGILDEDGTYFIYGHRTINLADLFNKTIPVFGITVLRDPLEMFGSRFSYQHTRHGRTDLEPEQFLKAYKSNRIVDFLGFSDGDDALARFRQYFSFVCIQESLNDSVSMLNYLLSLPKAEFESRNVVRAEDYVEINTDMVPGFVRDNVDDYVFYEYQKTRHSQLKRQFKRMDGVTQVKFVAGDNTEHAPAELNFDLDDNNNKFSLFMTGCEIWKTDKDKAFSFFDKAFGLQWSLATRVHDFVAKDDPKAARRWVRQKAKQLNEMGGAEATRMAKVLDERL